MEALMSELVLEVRKAISEISHDELNDIIVDDTDTVVRQCLESAANMLLVEAPADFLLPQPVLASVSGVEQDYTSIQFKYTDGHGYLVVPEDFLRLFELRLRSWQQSLTELLPIQSQEAKMQATWWGRGTPQKPRGFLTVRSGGNRVLMYFTAGRYSSHVSGTVENVYDHLVEVFSYIPKAKVEGEGDNGKLSVALTDICRQNVIYRSASIYLGGNQQADLAERFDKLSHFS